MAQQDLLLLPTRQLLEQFGAGNPTPGSGSAAALSGLLACKLGQTVCSISLRKSELQSEWRTLEFLRTQLTDSFEPALAEYFQKDSELFDQLISLRRLRDQETDPIKKRRYRDDALAKQRDSTEAALDIAKFCIALANANLQVFQVGWKSVRGDSGAAISCALSGVSASLFAAYLNLKDFRESEWLRRTKQNADDLFAEFRETQNRLVTLAFGLQEEAEQTLASNQLSLPLDDQN
ncbi:cyclodeaminase/cyclohydrolase family protein [Variovorax sp. PDC80]|uniref:cyclodeaminase/cyclohydrolase family protein n=1 Tax=Variovorax sp. PDC80 TaxID=1882827 RepID=UPI000B86F965|nr:cyclodeaminase/cyclohydrolase family protein [Variovorax sp. PDC80]